MNFEANSLRNGLNLITVEQGRKEIQHYKRFAFIPTIDLITTTQLLLLDKEKMFNFAKAYEEWFVYSPTQAGLLKNLDSMCNQFGLTSYSFIIAEHIQDEFT